MLTCLVFTNFVSMDNFDIVTALKTYAESKGWHFVFFVSTIDQDLAEVNIQTTREYTDEQHVLAVAISVNPTIEGSIVDSVRYECLMMFGRKFDENAFPSTDNTNGSYSNLDETDQQKYDRRLGDLLQLFIESIAEFGCSNELSNVSTGNITFAKNILDENMDFVVTKNANFTQLIDYGN